jgi:signal transduction histidine kinase
VRSQASAVLLAPIQRRTWAEAAYAAASLGLAATGFVFVVATVVIGTATAVTFVGLPVLAWGGPGARRFGQVQRRLAGTLLGDDVAPPPPFVASPGVLGWLQSALGDRDGWRARAYFALKLPLAALTGAAFVIWATTPYTLVFALLDGAFAVAVQAVLIVFAGPWLVRALIGVDRTLVRKLLGLNPGPARVAALEQARGRIADDAAATLRRIERDLHDGTQAQLGALAMNLGQVKEKLEHRPGVPFDPAGALALVEASHRHAKDALVELRDIVRGIHPPALDLGLEAALATLAARNPIPTTLHVDLARRPSEAIETMAYFTATELLGNALKHSQASRVDITVQEQVGRLLLVVRDDGVGGARPGAGTGLTGLAARLHAMDGELDVVSPTGGPTEIRVQLPLHA